MYVIMYLLFHDVPPLLSWSLAYFTDMYQEVCDCKQVGQSISLIGAPGVVLESNDQPPTLTVHSSGQVVLSELDVRKHRTGSELPSLALCVTCGTVSANNCTFTSQVGVSVVVLKHSSALSLKHCDISRGASRVYLSGMVQACVRSTSE
jgi:hypothetical protein